MKSVIYLVLASTIIFFSCKKSDNKGETQQQRNIVKEWLDKQEKSSIFKEHLTIGNKTLQIVTLDWNAQTAFKKGSRNFIQIPYAYGDKKIKSDWHLVFEIKNNTIISAKMKHISLLSYLDNIYFAEYWYDATGKLSELWQWRDNKFTKLDISSFYNTQSTNSLITTCYPITGTYWTYAPTADGLGIVGTLHTYYYNLCFITGGSQDESISGDFGGSGGSGGTGNNTNDPNADVITEELDKDCLKNAFSLVQNTQNIGGTPIMQNIKNALGASSITFNWNNSDLGNSNTHLYSKALSNGNGGFNITLNNSLLTSSSKEFISAVILNSYFQGFTASQGNTWANDTLLLFNVMDAMSKSLRQLHTNLPAGAEYAIALKVFYDGNETLFNQSQLAINLNTYYNDRLVNHGKIPLNPDGTVQANYDGWQVAKNSVGATYVNATNGTAVVCN